VEDDDEDEDEALELVEPLDVEEVPPDVELVLVPVLVELDAPPAPPSPELELDDEPEPVVPAEVLPPPLPLPLPLDDELVASVEPLDAWFPDPPQPTATSDAAIAAERKLCLMYIRSGACPTASWLPTRRYVFEEVQERAASGGRAMISA